jgi:hypothetical protein
MPWALVNRTKVVLIAVFFLGGVWICMEWSQPVYRRILIAACILALSIGLFIWHIGREMRKKEIKQQQPQTFIIKNPIETRDPSTILDGVVSFSIGLPSGDRLCTLVDDNSTESSR